MADSRQSRHGFTLVELLVVIAIIGILVALLLPAVQAARESARRTQCVNNLKQIGLALQTYHDSVGHFPTGRVERNELGVSWAFELLPYMEQSNIYDAWVPTEAVFAEANIAAMRTPVDTYYCPSRRSPVADRNFDDNSSTSPVTGVAAGGDYAASAGVEHNFDGDLDEGEELEQVAGVIHTFSKISGRQVTDGLSNTLAVGGRHIPPARTDVEPQMVQFHQGDTAFFASDRPTTIFAEWDIARGPNDESNDEFGSEHGEVVNFVFLDGHVANISRQVEDQVFHPLCTYADGQIVSIGDL